MAAVKARELTEGAYVDQRSGLVQSRADAQREHSAVAYAFATGEATGEDLKASREKLVALGDHVEGLDTAWEVSLGMQAERYHAEHMARRAEAGGHVRAQLAERLNASQKVQDAALALASAWREKSAAEDALANTVLPWIKRDVQASLINSEIRDDGAASHIAGLLILAGLDLERHNSATSAQVHGERDDGIVRHIAQSNRTIEARALAHLPELSTEEA